MDEFVKFLPSLANTINCLFHFHYLAISLGLLLFVELEKLLNFSVVSHVQLGWFVELSRRVREHFDHSLDGWD